MNNFVESSLNISIQKVNNDTYLKIFDTNIVDTELKPENLDTLTSDIELNLEHEKFALDTGFTAYEDLSKPIVIVINLFYLIIIFQKVF